MVSGRDGNAGTADTGGAAVGAIFGDKVSAAVEAASSLPVGVAPMAAAPPGVKTPPFADPPPEATPPPPLAVSCR